MAQAREHIFNKLGNENNNSGIARVDAIVVLGAGIWQSAYRRSRPDLYNPIDSYLPTHLGHEDPFGVLGGSMRLVATKELLRRKLTDTVAFMGGVSEKTKEKFGADVPPEGVVYERAFVRMLRRERLPLPRRVVETDSVNTLNNLRAARDLAQNNNWENLIVLTSDYHTDRITAFGEHNHIDLSGVQIMGAESYLQKVCPGKFDSPITTSNNSQAGRRRVASEEQGLRDLAEGVYFKDEFQFSNRHSPS